MVNKTFDIKTDLLYISLKKGISYKIAAGKGKREEDKPVAGREESVSHC